MNDGFKVVYVRKIYNMITTFIAFSKSLSPTASDALCLFILIEIRRYDNIVFGRYVTGFCVK